MKLVYKVDKKYDEMMIWEFMPKNAKKSKKALADLLRIDTEELNLYIKNNNFNLEKIVKLQVKNKYGKLLPFLKNSVSDYQKSWDRINKDFFKLVKVKTKHSWKYNNYYCIVSAYHEGISSWGKNTIARRWSINADIQKKVTAHELTLSHFWTMLDDNQISKNWSDDKKWQYSEVFSWCLLGLDEDFYKFWPWLLREHLFPKNHQYQEIVPLQNKLEKLYFKCDSFSHFFEKSIQLGK